LLRTLTGALGLRAVRRQALTFTAAMPLFTYFLLHASSSQTTRP
jgi:hypothetical protein